MLKNNLSLLAVWSIPILVYLEEPRKIDYVLVSLLILVCCLFVFISRLNKKSKFKIGTKEYIYLSLFLVFSIGFIFGFVIEANNLETNKSFAEFGLIDFVFPLSIITLASLPATYLILDSDKNIK